MLKPSAPTAILTRCELGAPPAPCVLFAHTMMKFVQDARASLLLKRAWRTMEKGAEVLSFGVKYESLPDSHIGGSLRCPAVGPLTSSCFLVTSTNTGAVATFATLSHVRSCCVNCEMFVVPVVVRKSLFSFTGLSFSPVKVK